MTTLIDTVDGPRPIYKARRPCAVCGTLYVSPNIKVKTCSVSCGSKLLSIRAMALRPKHTCHGCGVVFVRGERKRYKYCGRACAFEHTEDRLRNMHRHVANGALKWMQSWKTCCECGNSHTQMGSRCSIQCVRTGQYVRHKGLLQCKRCGTAIDRTTGRFTGPKKYCLACKPVARKENRNKADRVHKRVRSRRIRSGPRDRIDPYDVFARDGWKCKLCGSGVDLSLPVNHDLRPNLDHVIPLSKGGTHTYANVQTTCRRCNTDKGDKMPQVYTQQWDTP